MARSGAGLTVEGVEVLGSLRSGFDCPGVAAAPGSGGCVVCASATAGISKAAVAKAQRLNFGFMGPPELVVAASSLMDANRVPRGYLAK